MKTKITVLFLLISLLLLAQTFKIKVDTPKCVGCGDCMSVCPVNAITIIDGKAVIDTDKCIKCEICIKTCNYNAIRKIK